MASHIGQLYMPLRIRQTEQLFRRERGLCLSALRVSGGTLWESSCDTLPSLVGEHLNGSLNTATELGGFVQHLNLLRFLGGVAVG